jgi:hypothetical protein
MSKTKLIELCEKRLAEIDSYFENQPNDFLRFSYMVNKVDQNIYDANFAAILLYESESEEGFSSVFSPSGISIMTSVNRFSFLENSEICENVECTEEDYYTAGFYEFEFDEQVAHLVADWLEDEMRNLENEHPANYWNFDYKRIKDPIIRERFKN